MLHVQSFRSGLAGAGFRLACGRNRVRGDTDSQSSGWRGLKLLELANDMNGLLGMHGVKLVTGAAAAVLLMAYMGPTPALADTIEAALVRSYQNNPQLNAQRAQVRSTDENVPQALSGYRPRIALTARTRYPYT